MPNVSPHIAAVQAMEASLLSELRIKDQQLKDAEGRANIMEESTNSQRIDIANLRSQNESMARELRALQEDVSVIAREKEELSSKLMKTEVLIIPQNHSMKGNSSRQVKQTAQENDQHF